MFSYEILFILMVCNTRQSEHIDFYFDQSLTLVD